MLRIRLREMKPWTGISMISIGRNFWTKLRIICNRFLIRKKTEFIDAFLGKTKDRLYIQYVVCSEIRETTKV